MKVFISWSGKLSHQFAVAIKDWIEESIQAVQPWLSSEDIEKGSAWFDEIRKQLDDTSIGILCLTQENLNNPWVLFEAGAVFKGNSDHRVITLLVDLDYSDVKPPLSQLNHTKITKEEMLKLFHTVNKQLGSSALSDDVVQRIFNKGWEDLELKFNKYLKGSENKEKHKIERTDRDILEEILSLVRTTEQRAVRKPSDAIKGKRANRSRFHWSLDDSELSMRIKLIEKIRTTDGTGLIGLLNLVGIDLEKMMCATVDYSDFINLMSYIENHDANEVIEYLKDTFVS